MTTSPQPPPAFAHAPGPYTDSARIIFLHHSTGRNLIRQGRVRELIAKKNELEGTHYELWDHDYNDIGLTGPSGERMGISFNIPDDNTDPDALDLLFSQPVHDPPDNALSHLLQFDVVIFKSCFPVSAIGSRSQLEEYRRHYLSIRETLARYPHILFVALTPPPLVPKPLLSVVTHSSRESWTNRGDAKRAREFARWIASEEFRGGQPNVATLDLFDLLAETDDSSHQPNMLRAEYRSGRFGQDAHPNAHANEAIASAFAEQLWTSLREFRLRMVAGGFLGSAQFGPEEAVVAS
jgi:hypothetical protein